MRKVIDTDGIAVAVARTQKQSGFEVIIYTIGFTQKPAERFFGLLAEHGVKRVIDIRLHPGGQLSGFSKQEDLPYFLDRLVGSDYAHMPSLAPTDEIMKGFRTGKHWDRYASQFEALMDERGIPGSLDQGLFTDGPVCLLCSEAAPDHCHRRLVADRLAQTWDDVEIRHLV